MKIAFYRHAFDNEPRVEDLSWSELAAKLTTHTLSGCAPCPGHECQRRLLQPAWSPVDIEGTRNDANVRAVTAAVFDLDDVTEEHLGIVSEKLEGYSAIVYSTHGHGPGRIRLRLVIELSRPVLPREWPAVWATAVEFFQIPADPSCKNLSRLYFLPNHSGEREPFAEVSQGKPIDVDGFLAALLPAAALSSSESPIAAPGPNTDAQTGEPADLFALRGMLRRVRKPEHREIIRRVLAGEPLAPRGSQDNTLNQLMSVSAFVLPLETPEEAIVELFRPSFTATDWGEGTEHLCGQAVEKLRRHRERRKERDAKRLAENEAIWRALGGKPDSYALPGAKEVVEEDEPDPDAWMGQLITKTNATVAESDDGERVTLKNCEANLKLVLTHAPEWRGVLRYNEVTKEIEHRGGPLRAGVRMEVLHTEIAVWFQLSPWGRLGLMPKPSGMHEVIRQVALANAYDPLAEYLNGLTWDGTPRCDFFLERYFGAHGDLEHIRRISAKWLISAVARALRPGCKVDTVLILEGLQGIKKSTAFRTLSEPWFSDASIDLSSKDSAMIASRFWVFEFGELEGMRKADAQKLKAFFSRNEDDFRPPYERGYVKMPRRCVFVGSTNEDEYLRDGTGNRRFWPVKCGQGNVQAIREDRDQIWAEAVARFRAGERWWLEGEEATHAEAQAVERRVSNGGPEEIILDWLLKMPIGQRPREVSTDYIAEHALGLIKQQITRAHRMDVGAALKELGFRRAFRPVAGGVRAWRYVTPESLLEAQKTPALQVIAGAKSSAEPGAKTTESKVG